MKIIEKKFYRSRFKSISTTRYSPKSLLSVHVRQVLQGRPVSLFFCRFVVFAGGWEGV